MSTKTYRNPDTLLFLAAGVRLTALFLVVFASASSINNVLRQFSWTGYAPDEAYDAYYALTNAWLYTWGHELFQLLFGLILWFGHRRIARWCLPAIDPKACPHCDYDKQDLTTCPECGATQNHKIDHP